MSFTKFKARYWQRDEEGNLQFMSSDSESTVSCGAEMRGQDTKQVSLRVSKQGQDHTET